MKKRKIAGLFCLMAVFFLFLAGCEQEVGGTLSSDTTITGVTVSGVNALTLGTPDPDWTKATEQSGHIYLPFETLGQEVPVEVKKATAGTAVFLAQAKPNVMPDFVTGTVFSFESNDYLFVEAFSENLDAYSIYAIQIHRKTPNLADVTLAGRSAVGGVSPAGQPILQFGTGLGIPAPKWEEVTETGEIWYGDSQEDSSLALAITPEVPFTTVRVTTASETGTPIFTGPFLGAADGVISGIQVRVIDENYLYIEARGDDANFTDVAYYKIKMVSKKSNRALKSAKFVWYDGSTLIAEQDMGIGQMGTHSFAGSEAYGSYTDGAEIVGGSGSIQSVPASSTSILELYQDAGGVRPPSNFRLALVLEGEDPSTTFTYDITKNQRSVLEFTNTTGDFGNLLGFWWFGVEVTSEIGEKGWYKFATRIGSKEADLGGVKINGVPLETLPGGNHTATDINAGYVTVALPREQLSSLNIEASPAAGYQSYVSMVFAPDAITNVPQVTFNINEESNFDPAAWTNTTSFSIEPGGFVYIRVLAEISWYYGGSGFTGATWAPATLSPLYTTYKYYKIRFISTESGDANLTGLTYKGADITPLPAPVTVNQATTYASADAKGNLYINGTTTTTWGTEAAESIITDYSDARFQGTAGAGTQISYALAASNVTAPVAAASFTDSGSIENLVPNNYLVVRVAPANGADTSYYKVRVYNNGNSEYAPASISINGTSVGAVGAGNAAANGTTVISHSMAKAGFANVTAAVEAPSGANVAYAVAAANNTAPTADAYNTTGVFPNFPAAQWLVIRIISEDYSATRYYKVRLQANDANSAANLGEIRINGTPIETVPAANTAGTGTTAGLYHVLNRADLNELTALAVAATGSEGAAFAYASATAANTNPAATAYNTDGVFKPFNSTEWLVIRVISEDGLTTQYYKVRIAYGSDAAAITALSVNGTAITVPQSNTTAAGTNAVTQIVGAADLANVTIGVTPSPGATVDYNTATNASTGPTTWPVLDGRFTNFSKGSYVVIRVTPEDTLTPLYYKVQLTYGGTEANLTAIRINNTSIGTVPAPNAGVTGTTAATYSVANAAALNTVNVTVDASPGASVAYAGAAAANTNITAWTNTTGTFTSFVRNNYVAIRVISEDTNVTQYYKVRLVYGNTSADLTGININGASIGPVPAANTTGAGTTAADYNTLSYLNPVTVSVTGAPTGATVEYAVGAAANTNPTTWAASGNLGLVSGQYAVIRVTPEDTSIAAVYYKVRVIHGNDEADLYTIKLNDDTVVPTPTANTSVTGTNAGTITLAPADFASLRVRVGIDPGASAAYAGAASASANVTNWTNTTGNFTNFTPGNYLVIRVISQNGQETNYYKVQVNE